MSPQRELLELGSEGREGTQEKARGAGKTGGASKQPPHNNEGRIDNQTSRQALFHLDTGRCRGLRRAYDTGFEAKNSVDNRILQLRLCSWPVEVGQVTAFWFAADTVMGATSCPRQETHKDSKLSNKIRK